MMDRQRLERLHAHPDFETAFSIVARLRDLGHQTVLAGGCVRDGLRGFSPKDLDIATAAPPEAVEGAFAKTLAVGKAFGTIVVVEDGQSFEVTTFRSEGPYKDGRHPDHVTFTGIEEDARRRDFTVNALFYDPVAEAVLDFVGGVGDLKARRLRAVGDARARFNEDRLRMLRAVRFVAQLDFELDAECLDAIRELGPELASVSAERVLAEMKRFCVSPALVRGLEVFQACDLARLVWPEVSEVDPKRLEAFGPFVSWENAFAALVWLGGAKDGEACLRAWKASRNSIRAVDEQLRGARALLSRKTSLAEGLRALGSDEYPGLVVLAAGAFALENRIDEFDKWIKAYLAVAGPEGKLPPPLLGGQDLIAMGVSPGARMGDLLKKIYDEQLERKIRTREEALARARELN